MRELENKLNIYFCQHLGSYQTKVRKFQGARRSENFCRDFPNTMYGIRDPHLGKIIIRKIITIAELREP